MDNDNKMRNIVQCVFQTFLIISVSIFAFNIQWECI